MVDYIFMHDKLENCIICIILVTMCSLHAVIQALHVVKTAQQMSNLYKVLSSYDGNCTCKRWSKSSEHERSKHSPLSTLRCMGHTAAQRCLHFQGMGFA